eukprot:7744319-Lingulodinium_polyedra.AAC.1
MERPAGPRHRRMAARGDACPRGGRRHQVPRCWRNGARGPTTLLHNSCPPTTGNAAPRAPTMTARER